MKKTHQEFVKQAEQIHGVGKYQYLSTYVNALTPLLMRCTICGNEWSQKPNDHLNRHGCRHCAYIKNSEARHLTLDQVIAKARQIHGHRFQYPGPYLDAQSKMPIICPLHGTFYQRPANTTVPPLDAPNAPKNGGVSFG